MKLGKWTRTVSCGDATWSAPVIQPACPSAEAYPLEARVEKDEGGWFFAIDIIDGWHPPVNDPNAVDYRTAALAKAAAEQWVREWTPKEDVR